MIEPLGLYFHIDMVGYYVLLHEFTVLDNMCKGCKEHRR